VTASAVLDPQAPPPPQRAGDAQAARRPVPRALLPTLPADRARGWWVTLAVVAIAAGTRFWALGWPRGKIFDEAYYATEAQEMLRFGYEDNRGYMFIVHPPLGKWLIAAGSAVFGDNSVGWRVAPALAGILCVLILVRVTRRITGSTLLGAVAGLLLALDGLSLVMSRTALLDIFMPLFLLCAFASFVLDRDQVRARLAALYADGADLSAGVPTLGPRPWRLLAGVSLGLALSIKWSAASFAVIFVLMSLLWDRGALKSAGVRRPTVETLRRSVPFATGSLLVAPLATYLATWTGWLAGESSWNRHWGDTQKGIGFDLPSWLPLTPITDALPGPLRALIQYHYGAYDFHSGLTSSHAYDSSPWSWLVLGRPVSYYYPSDPSGCGAQKCAREILLIGTPALWWAFVPVLLWTLWHWATTRDWRAGAVLAAFVAGWAFWLINQERTMFLFYMTPLVPFLVLGVTLALGTLMRSDLARPPRRYDIVDDETGEPRSALLPPRAWGRAAACCYLGLVVANFVWLWPVLTGDLLTYAEWHSRMWFASWI
jgi:dolichyl-phosphate-mannose-protein mannosyltransferase